MNSESNQMAGTAKPGSGGNSDISQSSIFSKSSATREFCSTRMKGENRKWSELGEEKRVLRRCCSREGNTVGRNEDR